MFQSFKTDSCEPRRDKTYMVSVRPAKTQISLGIRPVWSESSLSAWRKLGSLATHWVHSEDSDQTGRMPRLIWVFTGRTLILLVLSWCGSFHVASVKYLKYISNIMRKPVLCHMWKPDTDQHTHPHSLISIFVFHCLESIYLSIYYVLTSMEDTNGLSWGGGKPG